MLEHLLELLFAGDATFVECLVEVLMKFYEILLEVLLEWLLSSGCLLLGVCELLLEHVVQPLLGCIKVAFNDWLKVVLCGGES